MIDETPPVDPFVVEQITKPVQFICCWRCRGDGWIEDGSREQIGFGRTCYVCGGGGQVATDGGPT